MIQMDHFTFILCLCIVMVCLVVILKFKADGFCDDNNNNAGCEWDGGDCCDASASYIFCIECECKDCTAKTSDECVSQISGRCEISAYQGDNYCDSGNNNAGCDWDGGDCCGAESNYVYCGNAAQCGYVLAFTSMMEKYSSSDFFFSSCIIVV